MAGRKRKAQQQQGVVNDVDAADDAAGPSNQILPNPPPPPPPNATEDRRRDQANLARRRAAHFATWDASAGDNNNDDNGTSSVHGGGQAARSLGPWSSAVQLAAARGQEKEKRDTKIREAAREKPTAAAAAAEATWKPSRDPSLGARPFSSVPLLSHLCVRLVVDYLEDVETLWGLPDAVRSLIAAEACKRRCLKNPATLRLFVEHSPVEIDIPDCTHFDPDVLLAAVVEASTPKLEKLDLGLCGRGLTDTVATQIAAQGVFVSLKSLKLGGAYRLSDTGLTALLARTPALMSLAIPQCCRIEGSVIEQGLSRLTPHLTHLDLGECRGVSAASLVAALQRLPALDSLILDGISEVDDSMLCMLSSIKQSSETPLRHLSLAACPRVTNKGVEALVVATPHLQTLVLDECSKVGNEAVFAIAQHCPELQTISLQRCTGVGDEAVMVLASSLTSLRSVSLGGVVKLTGAAVGALARGPSASSLEIVDLSWCRGVQPLFLGLLADSCRRLKVMKLWGCSQAADADFLLGHSNDELMIEGCVGST